MYGIDTHKLFWKYDIGTKADMTIFYRGILHIDFFEKWLWLGLQNLDNFKSVT